MKRLNIMAAAVVIILILSSLTGCETFNNFKTAFFSDENNPESAVRIGVFEPLSGMYEEYGELEKIGIELAHNFYPTALGKKVELIYADNKSDIYVAESAIQSLISKRPAIVLGSYGGVYSLIAAQYLEEAKIPAIAITNTNWLVTSNNPYYFRVCFVYAYEGVAVAKYAVEEMGVASAAILKPINNDSAIAVAQAFGDKMVQLTQNENAVVSSQDFDALIEGETPDFTNQLEKIKASGAEVVFLPASVDEAAEILKQARKLNVNAVFLGTDNWDAEELTEKAGIAAEGVAFSTIFDPESGLTDMTEVFLREYRKQYGEDAVPPSAVAHGFDAYMLAVDSLNRTGTALDGEKLAGTLTLTKEFMGASGSITFDENGDPIKSVIIKSVKGGEIVSTYTVEPVWVDLTEEGTE